MQKCTGQTREVQSKPGDPWEETAQADELVLSRTELAQIFLEQDPLGNFEDAFSFADGLASFMEGRGIPVTLESVEEHLPEYLAFGDGDCCDI